MPGSREKTPPASHLGLLSGLKLGETHGGGKQAEQLAMKTKQIEETSAIDRLLNAESFCTRP